VSRHQGQEQTAQQGAKTAGSARSPMRRRRQRRQQLQRQPIESFRGWKDTALRLIAEMERVLGLRCRAAQDWHLEALPTSSACLDPHSGRTAIPVNAVSTSPPSAARAARSGPWALHPSDLPGIPSMPSGIRLIASDPAARLTPQASSHLATFLAGRSILRQAPSARPLRHANAVASATPFHTFESLVPHLESPTADRESQFLASESAAPDPESHYRKSSQFDLTCPQVELACPDGTGLPSGKRRCQCNACKEV